jgi:hypothetical protein
MGGHRLAGARQACQPAGVVVDVRTTAPQARFSPHREQSVTTPNEHGARTWGALREKPLTRPRSEQPGDIAGKPMVEYYTQRFLEGVLIISEATSISVGHGGCFAQTVLSISRWRAAADLLATKRRSPKS